MTESMEQTVVETQTLLSDVQNDRLFGTDVEFLQETGSFDIFLEDPETGESALEHILIGDKDGGFHCESAASLLGLDHPSRENKTIVDREHLKGKNSKQRKVYRERPFEPYKAQVVVGGEKKLDTDSEGNSVDVGMFPKEYDPVSVIRAINIAYAKIDPEEDVTTVDIDGQQVIVNSSGSAPMLDGKTPMRMRMILDPSSRKVIAAYPLTTKNGFMNLSEEDVEKHLLGSIA